MIKLVLVLFLIVSCSSSLKVNPGRCSGLVRLKQKKEQSQASSTFIHRQFGFGQEEVGLDELLIQAKAPDCNRIEAVNLSIESDFWDQFISIIPLVSQWSIGMNWDEVQKAK